MNQRNNRSLPACGQILCVSLLLLGWAAAGCSRGLQRPIVHPVEGLVTLDGQPIEGVGVSFKPIVPGKGAAAFGKTLSDGSFSLTSTHGGLANAGAMAGEYAVMFQKFIDVAADAVPPRTAVAADDPTRQVPQWFLARRRAASRMKKPCGSLSSGCCPRRMPRRPHQAFGRRWPRAATPARPSPSGSAATIRPPLTTNPP